MVWLILLLAFISTALLAWTVLGPKDTPILRRIRGERQVQLTSARRFEGTAFQRLIGPAARSLGRKLVHLLPSALMADLDRMLTMANSRLSVGEFAMVWAASIAFGAAAFWLLVRSNSQLSPILVLMFGLVIAISFGLGPYMVLRHKMKARQEQIARALPYALDLLVTCVEAGLGVEAAMAVVTEKTRGALPETFAVYLREVGMGLPRREALAQIARRTGARDLARLAAAVAQAEEMGITIGDVLRVQAHEMRLERRHRAEAAAQRAPVMMAIPLTTCFLPGLVAVTVVPALLNMAMNFVGRLGTGSVVP